MDSECSICLETLKYEEIFKTSCKHNFHRECIGKWIKRLNDECPYCRNIFSEFDKESFYDLCISCEKRNLRICNELYITEILKRMNPNIEIWEKLCKKCLFEIDCLYSLFKIIDSHTKWFLDSYVNVLILNEREKKNFLIIRKFIARKILELKYFLNENFESFTDKLLTLIALYNNMSNKELYSSLKTLIDNNDEYQISIKIDGEYMNFSVKTLTDNDDEDEYINFIEDYSKLLISPNYYFYSEKKILKDLVKKFENYTVLTTLISFIETKLFKKKFFLTKNLIAEVTIGDLKEQFAIIEKILNNVQLS